MYIRRFPLVMKCDGAKKNCIKVFSKYIAELLRKSTFFLAKEQFKFYTNDTSVNFFSSFFGKIESLILY